MSRVFTALVCSVSLMGCIITREPSYSASPNTPPVLLEHMDARFDRVVNVDLSMGGGPGIDGGAGTQIPFTVTVRDPDVNEDLEAVVFLDRDPSDGMTTAQQGLIRIPATGQLLREVSFDVDRASLISMTGDCRTIELHVSGEFTDLITNPRPVIADDLGRAIWWVHAFPNPDSPISMGLCTSRGDSAE